MILYREQWTPLLLLVITTCINGQFFSGSDDKFIKKYAMMKVYESCFGQEVIKQVCREMNEARLRCASSSRRPAPVAPATAMPQQQQQQQQAQAAPAPPLQQQQQQQQQQQIYVPKIPMPTHLLNQQQQQQQRPVFGFDPAKLEQAILAVRIGQVAQQNPYKGYPGGGVPSYRQPSPIFTPGSADYFANPAYNPLLQVYSPYSGLQSPELISYPGGMYAPAASAAYRVWPAPVVQQQQHRTSRDMDLRSTIEALTTRMSGRVRNVTCVMQELGYLDENLEPNYNKMIERIDKLNVDHDLKKDMLSGIDYCKQFAQCLPETPSNRFGLNREVTRPMFFFKCYKQKKLEACVMKDVREKLSSAELSVLTSTGDVGGPEMRTEEQVNQLQVDPTRIISEFFEQDNDNTDWGEI